ncbi:helix-turn-helix transcriptional regulator [uncultured Psychroserpens sp.]|uniref:helix-turn-helix domain-containing protein n=1 Tax=uncultured Psychroserpens sp. TaxID=255436 RepID=UPI002627FE6D|nr:helix-turn-helix transcriptional regulator [uncultured Psychroserpens sp.]
MIKQDNKLDVTFSFICFMSPKDNHTKLINFGNESDRCSISGLIKACDCLDNLLISIYLLKKDKFIYCNSMLEKIVGHNSCEILSKGWQFWFDMVSKDEVLYVKSEIEYFFSMSHLKTSHTLKYHIINEDGKKTFLRHELLRHCIDDHILVVNYFFDITEKEKIETYFKVDAINDNDFYKKKNLISPREKEVLMLVADGFSSKQIADMLYISNHTAITHRKNLIEKFKVKNTAQLIKKASRNIEFW